MNDAACVSVVINLVLFIGGVVFYRTMLQGANATIILACKTDHGHGATPTLPCDCECHRPKNR